MPVFVLNKLVPCGTSESALKGTGAVWTDGDDQ